MVFCVTSLGGLYLEGLIFEILQYLITKVVQTVGKKKVDLVMALRTMSGEWGGIQALVVLELILHNLHNLQL